MYGKIFASLYTGSMRGQLHLQAVFVYLLANCDANGIIDEHPRGIAEATGLTIDQTRAALLALESEDPESRTPDHNGARIQRLDTHRDWGWRILNRTLYRDKQTRSDTQDYNRRYYLEVTKAKRSNESSRVKDCQGTSGRSRQTETEIKAKGTKSSLPTLRTPGSCAEIKASEREAFFHDKKAEADERQRRAEDEAVAKAKRAQKKRLDDDRKAWQAEHGLTTT